jgi:gentisate 1,2-dioxygenase
MTLTDVASSRAPWQLHADTGDDIFVASDAPVLEELALFRSEVVEVSR